MKWEYYSALAKDLMVYTDTTEMDTSALAIVVSEKYMDGHITKPYFLSHKNDIVRWHVCMKCSMEKYGKTK